MPNLLSLPVALRLAPRPQVNGISHVFGLHGRGVVAVLVTKFQSSVCGDREPG
jgi:hypothetical protein